MPEVQKKRRETSSALWTFEPFREQKKIKKTGLYGWKTLKRHK